jgi:hypothetical protein
MARLTFFSFHYVPDVSRSYVVKNSQVVKDHEDAGFLDSSAFEKAKNENPESLRRFLRKEMDGSSVVCVLIGANTAARPMVRFELLQGLWDGRGLLGIRIHAIKDLDQRTSIAGINPFDVLGVYVADDKVYLTERVTISDQWTYTTEFAQKVLPKWPYGSTLPSSGTHPLSEFFSVYSWSGTAHSMIGDWIETAATKAGR